ncbi:probable WRKY transcription factor 70 [Diospyros lotus]|uniref:probable WRKY transcription factor 70 n=1 Tax=Diospyros lotus TaxID=55363 RepID=UPI002254B5C1|nr:probable WRKY transcription factor 70 [Diospyros lotus]
MESSWPENSSAAAGKAFEKLIEGHELANQLQSILGRKTLQSDGGSLAAAKGLAANILRSFAATISIISEEHTAADEVSEVPANYSLSKFTMPDGWESEDPGESPAMRDRRGCYKRRKAGEAWTKIAPTPIIDNYAWRKYGQKKIINTIHPRHYYRCTHRSEKGCRATKQVQQIQNGPPMFITTYKGRHTCLDTIQKSIDLKEDTSVLINFGSTTSTIIEPPVSEPCFPAISFFTQEENKVNKSSWNYQQNPSPSLDYNLQISELNIGGGIVTTAIESSDPNNGDLMISSRVHPSFIERTCSEGLGTDVALEDVELFDIFGHEFW